ncbi:MAG: hypothetical protein KatS3mg002_0237 [Candidatus Woesearchaeota archaeon]|nr:MAG: hypothetical protein KatS3mg002_0237 [Candidatus Woesearchaeota archaeon]
MVNLIGEDGNAFYILAIVRKALMKNNVSLEEINLFMEEATSGDYDHLLQTAMKWVNIS